MRLSIAAFLFIGASGISAQQPAATNWPALLREARVALSTNADFALRLCNRAVAIAGTNVEPWLMRSSVRERQREFVGAIADASQAIKLKPDLAQAWQLRGTLNFKALQFRESVRDFDRFLDLVPAQRPHHWQRGISLYYAGDFAEGARQFESHETVNPHDVENDVWHFLCVARQHGTEKARASLMKAGSDPRAPMDAIYSLYAGKSEPAQVLASARSSRETKSAQFYARLYLGLYFDVQGEPARAREHIDQAVAFAGSDYMGDVARVHQQILRKKE